MFNIECGHSACSQGFIDSGKRFCVVQHSAVLAGLRLLQLFRLQRMLELPPEISDILTNGGNNQPIEADEIDTLCKSINSLEPGDDEEGETADTPRIVVTISDAGGEVEVYCDRDAAVRIIDRNYVGFDNPRVIPYDGVMEDIAAGMDADDAPMGLVFDYDHAADAEFVARVFDLPESGGES